MILQPGGISPDTILSAGVELRKNNSNRLFMFTNGGASGPLGYTPNAWVRVQLTFGVTGTDRLVVGVGSTTMPSAGQRDTPSFSLFSGLNGVSPANCVIAEVLLTNGPPTAAEIAAIEAYGLARYGGGPFA
jgi:hypothetical protein